jgi:hypothetical protein
MGSRLDNFVSQTCVKGSSKFEFELESKTCRKFSESNLNSNLGIYYKIFTSQIGQPRVAFGQTCDAWLNDALGWWFDH